ncbi:hypothetical protein PAAG_11580 [Paracoccidioides lutzii Pb01]|uniref:Uncharacterized protein n=1 Tax=Paracoccidioides lutzii (strain ATCC MYA-826 / Pb01) TaxID=502779 RepID=A0A0A2V2N6_PARBA|nr:hypothetical protein PAAG_11580 [Paracoccidioides lutzii Pb01]KGQ01728.1 hypothetical protein PAAG_11580 [Paracoccidioides lutzii Pb01]
MAMEKRLGGGVDLKKGRLTPGQRVKLVAAVSLTAPGVSLAINPLESSQ